MTRRDLFAMMAVSVALWAPCAGATTYQIDPTHSTVGFKVRHLFSKVDGVFRDVSGSFDYVPGHPEQWKAATTIQATSIDTRVEKRDQHLRSADFFDVATFPILTFTSTGVTDATDTTAKLHGTLALHGVEKPIVLDVTIHGEGKDPWGGQRSGFTATAVINRTDFGLTWNKAVEAGQMLVGDDVEILIEVEGVAKPSRAVDR